MQYENVDDQTNTLEGWVINKCNQWRDHYDSNYSEKFDEYYRLWRGIWASEDTMRSSERSRIISPALQQAVESAVAEVEEATFGRGKWFDIKDDYQDQQKVDIQFLRNQLDEDLHYVASRKAIAECILNAAVFGTGIGEIIAEEITEFKPATRPVMDGAMQAVGVEEAQRTVFKLRPVMPQNFLIDPVATSIDEALGVAIDEFVPMHQVIRLQEQGIYTNVSITQASPDVDLEPDQDFTIYNDDKVRLTKYYGFVPRELLYANNEEVKLLAEEETSEYVEAIVVIANNGTLLKG